jgi:transposase-like protein
MSDKKQKETKLQEKTKKLLEKNIKNLRENLDDLSMNTFVGKTIETLMLLERDEYLEEIDNPKKDKGNGHYHRSLKSLSKNSLLVSVPRTRSGLFSPATLELLKINREKVDEIALSLYKKGMTSNDIKEFLDEVFEEKMSPSKISNLAKTFHKFRKAWQNSKLEKHYKAVFADVVFITVKRGNEYAKEGVFVAYGVREDNRRELLVLAQNPTESASFWGELLRDLKTKQGVKEIDLFVADGLRGLEGELLKIYPNTQFQKCVVHKMRNILNKTSPKDKKEVSADLKDVFDNFDKDATIKKALKKKVNFLKKWKDKYPNFKNYFKAGEFEYYLTYIKFNPKVRRMIYTTNSIENLNRQIRKTTKNKLSFESPKRLLDYLFMIIKEFEEKNYMRYPIPNYKFLEKVDLKIEKNENENASSKKNIKQRVKKNVKKSDTLI